MKPSSCSGDQRREHDLAQRRAMRGAHHAGAVDELERALPAGARQHHHGIAHAHGEMRALAGLARQILEDRRRQAHHLDFVERAGGERKQRAADAVALGVLHLPHIAERDQRLDQMEGGGIVQADALRQIRPGRCRRGCGRSLPGAKRRAPATARRRAGRPLRRGPRCGRAPVSRFSAWSAPASAAPPVHTGRYHPVFSIGKWQFTMLNAVRHAIEARKCRTPSRLSRDRTRNTRRGGRRRRRHRPRRRDRGAPPPAVASSLLEKNQKPGGSTAWSVGSVSASRHAAPTRQRHRRYAGRALARHGRYSTARSMRATTRRCAAFLPTKCRRRSAGFSSHGIRFYGPMPEPPHTKPRMHNVLPNSRSFIVHLERAARRAGVTIVTAARARRLGERERSGRGGSLRDSARSPRVFARAAAWCWRAGDFTNDPELKARYMGAAGGQGRPASIPPLPATGRSSRSSLAHASSTAISRSGPNCASCRRPATTWCRSCRPGALARLVHGLVARSHTAGAAAAVHHELRHHRAGAIARACSRPARCWSTKAASDSPTNATAPALALPDQPGGNGYILLDRRVAGLFTAWPHFISTAPGVAYAYLGRLRTQPARRLCQRRDARRARAKARHAGRRAGTDGRRV